MAHRPREDRRSGADPRRPRSPGHRRPVHHHAVQGHPVGRQLREGERGAVARPRPRPHGQPGRHLHHPAPGAGHGHAGHAAAVGHQRHVVLPHVRADRVGRPEQQPGPPAGRLQLGQLPRLQHHRHPQRRALGPPQDDDVRRRRPVLVLRLYYSVPALLGAPVLCVAPVGLGVYRVLLPVLRLLRNRLAGRTLALSNGGE